MDTCVVNEICDVGINSIVTEHMVDEMEKQLSSNRFIAMHVCNILDIGFKKYFCFRLTTDKKNPKISF